MGFVEHIRSLFKEQPPKAAVSEQSTSNPPTISFLHDHAPFASPDEVSHFHLEKPFTGDGDGDDDEDEDEDSNYSQTVTTILQAQRSESLSSFAGVGQSSFTRWTMEDAYVHHNNHASQTVLKYIIFTVPSLHAKHGADSARPPPPPPPDELSANHVVAERRRREKLNERFIALRAMVPFVTKMDKVSILGDTIEYVKQLRDRIQDLEAEKRQQKRMRPSRKAKNISEAAAVEVSIIESDALLEMRCEYREGLLIDILEVLRELRIETTAVQTAVNAGVFTAEIRAKVKDNLRGKKVLSILDVKRAIHHILP